MSFLVVEKIESRRFVALDSLQLSYLLSGGGDEEDARLALQGESPDVWGIFTRQPVQVSQTSDTLWDGEVTYKYEPADYELSFDTTGGTTKVTQALSTRGSYVPDGYVAADFKGAINVTSDSVEGVDIVIPNFAFSETWPLPSSRVSRPYQKVLRDITGTVNQSEFRGFDPGEVLFLGASGNQATAEKTKVTYRFWAGKNAENLQVGDITVEAKYAWDYLWVRYIDKKDSASSSPVKIPRQVNVERVYDDADFGLLGIGVN